MQIFLIAVLRGCEFSLQNMDKSAQFLVRKVRTRSRLHISVPIGIFWAAVPSVLTLLITSTFGIAGNFAVVLATIQN